MDSRRFKDTGGAAPMACAFIAAVLLCATVLTSCARTEPTSKISSVPSFPDAAPGPYPVGHSIIDVAATVDRPKLSVDVWYPSKPTSGPRAEYQIIPGVDI